jgi:hypothetical protein
MGAGEADLLLGGAEGDRRADLAGGAHVPRRQHPVADREHPAALGHGLARERDRRPAVVDGGRAAVAAREQELLGAAQCRQLVARELPAAGREPGVPHPAPVDPRDRVGDRGAGKLPEPTTRRVVGGVEAVARPDDADSVDDLEDQPARGIAGRNRLGTEGQEC